MVALRAFDGLDADAILELGWQRLAEEKTARAAAAREIDPDADEIAVIDARQARPPGRPSTTPSRPIATAMVRARSHLIERDLVTVPDDERIDVIATPEYLRNVIPFAAYFDPGAFDKDPKGIYIVTPAVDGNPTAMREHNFSGISNTSIHEAYPGHHLQLDTARRHRSLTRLLTDAPEFVEGWGMYSELMMREHGFDDGPAFRVIMHTDAIWRACRIILDIRLHRGEITRRGGHRLPRRADELRAPERRRRGQLVHLPADLSAVVPARADAAAGTSRRRAAPPRRRVQPQGLPRHPVAQRLAADLVPSPAHDRRHLTRCRSSRPSTSRRAGRGSCTGRAPVPASARRPTGRTGSPNGSWRWAPG